MNIYGGLLIALMSGMVAMSHHEYNFEIALGGIITATLIGNGLAFWKMDEREGEDEKQRID